MHKTELEILNRFKKEPNKEFSTYDLAKEIFPEEAKRIDELMQKEFDKSAIIDAKGLRGELHRRLLYHLNQLVNENILKVSRIEAKGRKYFKLSVEEGDYIIEKDHRKIIISKPFMPSTPMDVYEHKKIVSKFEPESWINRLNCIILESSLMEGTHKAYNIISNVFPNVNDVLALNDFESLIEKSSFENLRSFIEKLNIEANDFEKTVSLIVNVSKINDESKFIEFAEYYGKLNCPRINFVFNLSGKELQKKSIFMEKIIKIFSDNKIKINIKNDELQNAPYIKGRAGMYTFDENEWNLYKKEFFGTTLGLNCASSSVAIDTYKFFQHYKTDSEFRNMILNIAKALLYADNLQRRKSDEYFRSINVLNDSPKNFYKLGRSYIRFWNYDWEPEQSKNTPYLLQSCKEMVNEFCNTERTIFKSCGIPIRFDLVFSSAFAKFDVNFLSERKYVKTSIRKIDDFYSKEGKETIYFREKIFEIFNGGDRIRFFRTGDFKESELIHEFSYLLNTTKIPFFCYDFSELRGNLKITHFM